MEPWHLHHWAVSIVGCRRLSEEVRFSGFCHRQRKSPPEVEWEFEWQMSRRWVTREAWGRGAGEWALLWPRERGRRLPGRGKQQEFVFSEEPQQESRTSHCVASPHAATLWYQDLWVSDQNHISSSPPPGFPPMGWHSGSVLKACRLFAATYWWLYILECGWSAIKLKGLVGQGAVSIGSWLCGRSLSTLIKIYPKTAANNCNSCVSFSSLVLLCLYA